MIFRRDEPFRFQFNRPIEGTFKIININGRDTDSKIGVAYILDLSPNGVRFKSPIELPIEDNQFVLEVKLELMSRTIRMAGKPKWKKSDGKEFVYGFIGLDEFQTKREIIDILKDYVKGAYRDNRK